MNYIHEILLLAELIILSIMLAYFGHQAINQVTPNQITVQIVTGLLVAFGATSVSLGTVAIIKKKDQEK